MPQITVDYSEELADTFDRRGFAPALPALLAEPAEATPGACKTRFVRTEGSDVGDGTGAATGVDGIVHVMIGLLPGRSDRTKARTTAAVLDLLGKHVEPADGIRLHASAEIRDLDASYLTSAPQS
ncbi:isomerase [Streptomyces arenae]|nr:isomerase [Streptomyces arenae]